MRLFYLCFMLAFFASLQGVTLHFKMEQRQIQSVSQIQEIVDGFEIQSLILQSNNYCCYFEERAIDLLRFQMRNGILNQVSNQVPPMGKVRDITEIHIELKNHDNPQFFAFCKKLKWIENSSKNDVFCSKYEVI